MTILRSQRKHWLIRILHSPAILPFLESLWCELRNAANQNHLRGGLEQ
jgi:hypothetical protein